LLNPLDPYGTGDNSAPTIVTGLIAGQNVTIAYVSGLTSSFFGVLATVDANGYGPSNGYNPPTFTSDQPGSSGFRFPGFYTSSPVDVVLNELMGTFADPFGQIIGMPFAIGDGPLTISVPLGATQLQLGVNDDVYYYTQDSNYPNDYPDNTGSLLVSVTADSLANVPGPIAGAGLPGLAFASGGLLAWWRRRRKAAYL
jgi:hypothetical protein